MERIKAQGKAANAMEQTDWKRHIALKMGRIKAQGGWRGETAIALENTAGQERGGTSGQYSGI